MPPMFTVWDAHRCAPQMRAMVKSWGHGHSFINLANISVEGKGTPTKIWLLVFLCWLYWLCKTSRCCVVVFVYFLLEPINFNMCQLITWNQSKTIKYVFDFLRLDRSLFVYYLIQKNQSKHPLKAGFIGWVSEQKTMGVGSRGGVRPQLFEREPGSTSFLGKYRSGIFIGHLLSTFFNHVLP